MGGAGNSGQEPGSQTAVTGGGTTPTLPGWGSGGVPGGGSPESGVPGADTALGLRPYEELTASVGAGPSGGLLAGSPVGSPSSSSLLTVAAPAQGFSQPPGFNSSEYPEVDRERQKAAGNLPLQTIAAPAPPPPPAPTGPVDPWADRVQIFGSGAEGFGTDTSAQWLSRWPSQAQAEQKPGTDNWYLPVGVKR